MRWPYSQKRSAGYLQVAEQNLIARLRGGWELCGQNYRKGDFIDAEEAAVIEFALERGTIVKVGEKPDRYELAEKG